MMKIEKLEPSKRKEGRWLVWLEDGTLIRADEGDVAALGLYAGMELTEEQERRLEEAAALSKVKNRALNIVCARSVSRRELVQKLTARPRRSDTEEDAEEGECARERRQEQAEAAADWLERIGLLNDEQYAKDVVRRCGEKGFGERRIRDELFRRGMPRALWDAALEERADPAGAIDRFLAQRLKNWTGERKELKRAADALARKGFSWPEIAEALERYEAALDD